MPMLVDVVLDGEFEGWTEDGAGEYYEYQGRTWLVDNGQVIKVGN